MKCKNCKYYTGVQCHGHGDYWGDCKLIESLYSRFDKSIYKKDHELEDVLSRLGYKEYFIDKVIFSLFSYICYDDTDCMFKKFVDDIYSRGIITDKQFDYLEKKDAYKQC